MGYKEERKGKNNREKHICNHDDEELERNDFFTSILT